MREEMAALEYQICYQIWWRNLINLFYITVVLRRAQHAYNDDVIINQEQ